MAKVGPKEIQARALREAQQSSRGGGTEPSPPKQPKGARHTPSDAGVAPSPREAKSNSDADRSVPVRKPKPVPASPRPKASTAASGSTTHQYRDPEKRKAYMAKYMRDRRRREAEKRAKEMK